jgi:hypothetical protein
MGFLLTKKNTSIRQPQGMIRRSLHCNKPSVGRICRVCLSQTVGTFVRNAHASEIFRAAFFNLRTGESIIPVEDLDQLIVREKVRPSLSLTPLEVVGGGLGLLSRFAPKRVADALSEAVDDATTQQFNDSVRTMQLDSVENVDVKETLKYHRDLRGFEGSEPTVTVEPPQSEQSVGAGGPTVDSKSALTTALYHLLKVSAKY